MKSLLISLVVCLGAFSASAEDLFPALSDNPGMNIVYVSKEMMMNSNTSRSVLYDQLGIYNAKNINDFYIYSPANAEGKAALDSAFAKFEAKNKEMKVLMKSKTNKEETTIYGIPYPSDPRFYSAILLMKKGKDSSLIVLTGAIALAQYGG